MPFLFLHKLKLHNVRPLRGLGKTNLSFYIYLTSPRSCFKAFKPYTLNFSETMF